MLFRSVELLVGPGEVAPRQRAPRDDADVVFLTEGQHLPLLLAVEQVVVVLHRDELVEPEVLGGVLCLGELVGPHRTRAEIADLLAADRVVEGTHRHVDGRVVVPAVSLVEIDRLHTQSFTTGVEFLLDRLPGEPARVRVLVVHLEEALRRDDHLVSSTFEGITEDAL